VKKQSHNTINASIQTIIRAFIVLFNCVFLSSTLLLILNYYIKTIDNYSEFYDFFRNLIVPVLFSANVVVYSLINNRILKIFNNQLLKLSLYLFVTTLICQLIAYSMGYLAVLAFPLIIFICQGLSFFIEHKKRLGIFLANITVFAFIIVFGLTMDSFIDNNYFGGEGIIMIMIISYFGIFHFLYVLFNLRKYSE